MSTFSGREYSAADFLFLGRSQSGEGMLCSSLQAARHLEHKSIPIAHNRTEQTFLEHECERTGIIESGNE